MSGGGRGDRDGDGAALLAVGDRPFATRNSTTPLQPIRALPAALFDLSGDRIATVMVIADEVLPQLIMFEGDPFLFERTAGETLFFQQVRPMRAIKVSR